MLSKNILVLLFYFFLSVTETSGVSRKSSRNSRSQVSPIPEEPEPEPEPEPLKMPLHAKKIPIKKPEAISFQNVMQFPMPTQTLTPESFDQRTSTASNKRKLGDIDGAGLDRLKHDIQPSCGNTLDKSAAYPIPLIQPVPIPPRVDVSQFVFSTPQATAAPTVAPTSQDSIKSYSTTSTTSSTNSLWSVSSTGGPIPPYSTLRDNIPTVPFPELLESPGHRISLTNDARAIAQRIMYASDSIRPFHPDYNHPPQPPQSQHNDSVFSGFDNSNLNIKSSDIISALDIDNNEVFFRDTRENSNQEEDFMLDDGIAIDAEDFLIDDEEDVDALFNSPIDFALDSRDTISNIPSAFERPMSETFEKDLAAAGLNFDSPTGPNFFAKGSQNRNQSALSHEKADMDDMAGQPLTRMNGQSSMSGQPLTRMNGFIGGQPLTRMASKFKSLLPSRIDPKIEYKPWIPVQRTGQVVGKQDPVAESKLYFNLYPLNPNHELLENDAESSEGAAFFNDTVLPLQDYGKFPQNLAKVWGAASLAAPHSEAISTKILQSRQEELETGIEEFNEKLFGSLITYARKCKAGAAEIEWVKDVLNGKSIDFEEYYLKILATGEINSWSCRRGKQFIKALIPSIIYSQHCEEVLSDFLNDFYLPQIVTRAYKQIKTEVERAALAVQLSEIITTMIKYFIHPAIIEKFLNFVCPILRFESAEKFYQTLVDAVTELRIPNPHVPEPDPIAPRINDDKYTSIADAKLREDTFKADYEKYVIAFDKNKRKNRFKQDLIRIKKIHKNRAFDILRILVLHLADPIMRPNSPWITARYLKVPYNVASEDPQNVKPFNPDSKVVEDIIFVQSLSDPLHPNQDFFDALFFSRILRACMTQDDSISMVHVHLHPFLSTYQGIHVQIPEIGLRYLYAINRFLRLSRFNTVSNVTPEVINSRRFILSYLTIAGANLMHLEPEKIINRATVLNAFSLFEAIELYQICGVRDVPTRIKKLVSLIASPQTDFRLAVIFFTYNPLDYEQMLEVIAGAKDEIKRSKSKRNTEIFGTKISFLHEIFALCKGVGMPSIFDRKVLKYIAHESVRRPTQEFKKLNCNNTDLDRRERLPTDYKAVYEWKMSKSFKDLPEIANYAYPYFTYAAQIVLARRFGISFDNSNFSPQTAENITWIECVGFANFCIEREAQELINRSLFGVLDATEYQVYRIVDPYRKAHEMAQLPADEPTHHINLLIQLAFSALPDELVQQIRLKFPRTILFRRFRDAIGHLDPQVVFGLSKEEALQILTFIEDTNNDPKNFRFN